ncbi:hypothetical protein ANO11243_001130 [Dothideomycetidae sp. 11243]|nr:hypothetical protein ANO11243_001130 [fungal sp. No.11243]
MLALVTSRYLHPEQRIRSFRRVVAVLYDPFAGRGPMSPDTNLDELGPGMADTPHAQRWLPLAAFAALVLALCTKVAVFRFEVQNSECSRTSLAMFIPAALALVDALVAWKARRHNLDASSTERTWHYTVPAFACCIFGYGGWMLQKARLEPSTTYICPTAEILPRLIPALQNIGVFADVVIVFCVLALIVILSRVFEAFYLFSPHSPIREMIGFVLGCGGVWLFVEVSLLLPESQDVPRLTLAPQKTARRVSRLLTLIIMFWGTSVLWNRRDISIIRHPIEELIAEAKTTQIAYTEQAMKSRNLAEAVTEYRRRYERYPPPGFDAWYKFATNYSSFVIDDFDAIMRDLAPFEQFSPETLRHQTWEAMSNPDDDISGISIRNGKASMCSNVKGTHAWMIEGILEMIAKFEKHLPDMDIGFNINDEPRVIGPHNTFIQPPYPWHVSSAPQPPKSTSFSSDRAAEWDAASTLFAGGSAVFEDRSLTNVYSDYGLSACRDSPPSAYYTDASQFCPACIAGHSRGVFLANWSASTNICEQPDLSRQHGFYASSASFKGSHTLYPVFSQSKAPFFADILFPSPWNYLEKAIYAPSPEYPDTDFEYKNKTIFWRGSTTEGLSHGGAWRGFARERFVNLANDPHAGDQLVLLPFPSPWSPTGQTWGYHPVPAGDLQRSLQPSMHFTEVVRCAGVDCPRQTEHFSPLAPSTDFQAHWSHAYLLDLDGAGFSGRFLPFLRSKSLPFKAALFREWYDDRVRAWAHFIPLDIRGHGLWASLLYFTGLEGRIGGKMVDLKPHHDRAKDIAYRGRDWAEKVLRKEDMEIYMFRLLLEWGRMTDDRRGDIGFDIPRL